MSASSTSTFGKGLDTDVQFLKGVGPRLAEQLGKAGLRTVRDVLFHFPRRYEDRRNIPPIRSVQPGTWATVRGRVIGVSGRPTRGGKVVLKVGLTDGDSALDLVWFNQPWIRRKLEHYRGEMVAYGQVKQVGWSIEMHSPEFELLDEDAEADAFARIVPVYPLVEGLYQKVVRKAASSALEHYLGQVDDPLPEALLRREGLKPLRWSLRQMHQPTSEEERLQARKRLVFEEFFYLQVGLALQRAQVGGALGISFGISRLHGGCGPLDEARSQLPFELTRAQHRVIAEIWADMERPHPMNRLLQGDVGSGKTAVAACAMLAAVRCGFQAALMAPTEILAEQHAANLKRLFEPADIHVALLVGKQTATEKKRAYKEVAEGKAQIAVGTHALIQEAVEFKHLGLVIVDEQHRFGVLQRAALRGKGLGNPDVLVMTATPIPRTLTMTLYGDLDVSVIDELPPGRKPIKTHWKRLAERGSVYEGVRELLKAGRQAYFVCPLVGESEKLLAQASEELHLRLSTQVFPEFRVGLLHGQLKPSEKEQVMEAFRRHDLDVLVSTTVIEVGVDVPNASIMVVEDANRFGLAQLHQLRGRVGRGDHQSYCILVADASTDDAKARLDILVGTSDGFKIAEEDLRIRGPGEIAGTRQSGNLDFKLADLVQDTKLLEVARQAAIRVLEADPTLSRAEHRGIARKAAEQRGSLAVAAVS